MLPHSSPERILKSVDLEDDEPSFLPSVSLRVKRASGDLYFCDILADKSLEDFFSTALDESRDRRV